MDDDLDRLKASNQKNAETTAKEGRQHGVNWAKSKAKYDELKRAARIDTSNLSEGYADDTDWHVAQWAAKTIIGDEERPSDDEMANLFGVDEDMLGDVVTVEFIEGFVEGAADVWEEVKGRLLRRQL